MNDSLRTPVVIVGSGAREHVLAWLLSRSSRVSRVWVTPGNGGTAKQATAARGSRPERAPVGNLDVSLDALPSWCLENEIGLVVIGPEVPLANGLADALRDAGVRCFGPSRAAAELEASKAFAKAFMARHAIPTARGESFTDLSAALDWLGNVDYDVVVKASGLAAGKGVIIPNNRDEAARAVQEMMGERRFGAAGDTVLLEERMSGPEVSVLALCDGESYRLLPLAQDHKRLLDGDLGPNTGGMGAYAPAPLLTPAELRHVEETIIRPTLDGMRAEGRTFSGVLYTGLMLTSDGPRVLEYNCRFGDPEAQVVLPLLATDPFDVFVACAEGRLGGLELDWHDHVYATVVVASGGYPGATDTGHAIDGEPLRDDDEVVVFHAGSTWNDSQLTNSGGRVMSVTARGDSLSAALDKAYAHVGAIGFSGMQFRTDIGKGGLPSRAPSAYQSAGVDIDAAHEAVDKMKAAVSATHGPEVLAGIGSFGGLFDASGLAAMQGPVLVASTDGVGTKTRVATAMNRFDSIGADLVNHSINDILVQGARPLFFLDYVATSKLRPDQIATVVNSMAHACREAGCAVLGGETAEMPGVYVDGELDVVGTIVGVVERGDIIDGSRIEAGDAILALASTGLHTNGYSLARKVLADLDWHAEHPALSQSVGEALLAVHRSYLREVRAVQAAGVDLRGLVHITGGGLIDNPPRILPAPLAARVQWGSWAVPPIFELIAERGEVEWSEMLRVFNCGVGMMLVVPADQVDAVRQALPGEAVPAIGTIVERRAAPVEIEWGAEPS